MPYSCRGAPRTLLAVSRRADPARIEAARRAAVLSRLTGSGMTEATAETWCAAWEAHAASEGVGRSRDYWRAGLAWIEAQRAAGRRSP